MATVIKIDPLSQVNAMIDRGEFTTSVVTVTPEIAAAILADRNPDNRPINLSKLGQYTTDISAGRWAMNGEPILFSACGKLNDGQHRLRAVVDAGRSADMLFVFGLPRESRMTVDQGRNRTAAAYLAMEGVSSATVAAGMARILIALEARGGEVVGRINDVTNGEACERVRSDERLREIAAFADAKKVHTKGMLTPTQLGVCVYLIKGSHELADEFISALVYGENITRQHPAWLARTRLLGSGRLFAATAIEIVMRAWCAFRDGRTLERISTSGRIPKAEAR